MRLYLSSFKLGERAPDLVDMVGEGGRIGVVLNSRDTSRGMDGDEDVGADEEFAALAALGLRPEEVDLREHFGDPDGLRRTVEHLDALLVVGGNSFVLSTAMVHSGFLRATDERVRAGDLVYAGYSAGSCLAGPDLRGCHLIDDETEHPVGYPEAGRFDALGWIPWRIIPHWRSDHPESEDAETASEWLDASGLSYRVMRDGEVLVIDGADRRTFRVQPD
ncbi:MAG: hypothetical protein GEU71_16875 [Actinobacteria bacterium]|nr:hypothetical protein [Actinomycetota bacterium]